MENSSISWLRQKEKRSFYHPILSTCPIKKIGEYIFYIGFAILIIADWFGVNRAFSDRGIAHGVFALFFPPYALYQSVDWILDEDEKPILMDIDGEKVAVYDGTYLLKTHKGRNELSEYMRLEEREYLTLLQFVEEQQDHTYKSVIEDDSGSYNIEIVASPAGSVVVTVFGVEYEGIKVSLIDQDRDQKPDKIKVETVDGVKEEFIDELPKKYDRSELLTSWRFSIYNLWQDINLIR